MIEKGKHMKPEDIKPIDISSEEWRVYAYDGDKKTFIHNPSLLYVINDDKGVTHRVLDKDGVTHRPERGWLKISWKPREGHPAFVA
jgi:hypothetical protein